MLSPVLSCRSLFFNSLPLAGTPTFSWSKQIASRLRLHVRRESRLTFPKAQTECKVHWGNGSRKARKLVLNVFKRGCMGGRDRGPDYRDEFISDLVYNREKWKYVLNSIWIEVYVANDT
jgi:hypothetical protein